MLDAVATGATQHEGGVRGDSIFQDSLECIQIVGQKKLMNTLRSQGFENFVRAFYRFRTVSE